MKALYIIDASGYLYRSYFAIRNMTNSQGESTNALYGFVRFVLKLFSDFDASRCVVVFDGPNNSKPRQAIYPAYKSNREKMPGDLIHQIEWAREFCKIMNLPFLNIAEVEADDVMGSIAVFASSNEMDVYLCTTDKDMCQFVNERVKVLNTYKENMVIGPSQVEELYGVRPDQIVDFLSITGDASDNIPGVSGFGAKTAASLLKTYGTLDYLLEHPEVVPGKKREVLQQEAPIAVLSRELVKINTLVDVPRDISFYEKGEPAVEKLREFYQGLGFNSLLKDLGSVEKSSVEASTAILEEYVLVDDEKALRELICYLSSCPEVCFNTATTGVKPMEAELVGVGFGAHPGKAWYIPVNGKLGLEYVTQALKPLFENPKIGFYGHNVKYDCHVLKNYQIDVSHICFDTMLASFILNAHIRNHSLDALSLEYFGKVKQALIDLLGKGKQLVTMRDVFIERVSSYCCEGVDYAMRLKEILEKKLKERGLDTLFNSLELPLLKVLAEMEKRGIYLDVQKLQETGKIINQELVGLSKEIFEIAEEEFNLNSPRQISEILFTKMKIHPPKKTATGYSTNADVLESLQHEYLIAKKLLEHRGLEKLRSTYVESLPGQVNQKTHRIHCTFNQFGASTGRLSCQDPNLQNIPVRTEVGRKVREAFKPEKAGWSYLAADYSQIELRLLAHLSADPALLQAFNNGEDVHAYTASCIYNVPLSQVSREMRHNAKAVNFGIVYGQGSWGLSEQLGVSKKEASDFINLYFLRYSKIKEYLEESKAKARATGKSVTMTGRERIIPEINSKNAQIKAAAERLAINTPLQGTAADLIKMAMLKVDAHLKKERALSSLILQIHDELIFEVPDFELITLRMDVQRIMQTVMKLKVPLIVDIEVGKNWKEC